MNFRSTFVLLIALTMPASAMTGWLSLADDLSDAEAPYTVRQGLDYCHLDPKLKLDLFLPRDTRHPVACVIVIQGGGFNAQNGQKFRPFAVYLAEHGIAAALIAYRGRSDHTYRDTIADTKAAVRFIRKVSERYHIDPDRIGAMGRSAGGTLAALLAVTGDMQEFEGAGGNSEYSSRIQAAVAFAGVFDFVARFSNQQQIALQPRLETKIQSNGEWIGVPFARGNQHWLSASAINHVDKGDAPVLFIHCKDDATVPWVQSRDMAERMKTAGVRSAVKYFDTGGHGFGKLGTTPMKEMVKFFRETL